MTPTRRRRLLGALVIMLGVAIAAALISMAFRENLTFFFTPAQVLAGEAPAGQPLRLGGLVVPGSIERGEGLGVRFAVTDTAAEVPVYYEGVLPDLFGENQGVVVRGTLDAAGQLTASQVLAKHDENYMPPEVADALRAQGVMPPHEMVR